LEKHVRDFNPVPLALQLIRPKFFIARTIQWRRGIGPPQGATAEKANAVPVLPPLDRHLTFTGQIVFAVRLFLLLAAALIIGRPGPALAVENSRELAKYCEAAVAGVEGSGNEIEIPNTQEALLCWGYMEALQDLSALVDQNGTRVLGVCPPQQGRLLDLVRSFVAYADSHPINLPKNSAAAAVRALQQVYPCADARTQGAQLPP
jgi:Rap1a immunity proteins